MWFFFGFITLISFSVYFCYKRINAAWSGIKGTSNGISFQYKVIANKYKVTGLLVGIDAPKAYDYSLKKETSVDKFFKFVRLSNEHQIGNEAFDQLIYIVSDNLELHRQISSNTIVKKTVVEIFKFSDSFNCKTKEIRHNSGRLWVRYKTSKGFEKNDAYSIAEKTANLLEALANEIEHIPKSVDRKWKEPFALKAAIILAISTGLAANGFFHAVRLTLTNAPFTVDRNTLLFDSIYLGGGIIFILIILSIVLLGRSARTHLVMIELLLIGTFGAVTTSLAELRDINIEQDISTAQIYETKLLDKKISRGGRRRSTSYKLYINDWNNESYQKTVKVSSRFYHSVSIGDTIRIKQRKGYLKYRWVESLERKVENEWSQ